MAEGARWQYPTSPGAAQHHRRNGIAARIGIDIPYGADRGGIGSLVGPHGELVGKVIGVERRTEGSAQHETSPIIAHARIGPVGAETHRLVRRAEQPGVVYSVLEIILIPGKTLRPVEVPECSAGIGPFEHTFAQSYGPAFGIDDSLGSLERDNVVNSSRTGYLRSIIVQTGGQCGRSGRQKEKAVQQFHIHDRKKFIAAKLQFFGQNGSFHEGNLIQTEINRIEILVGINPPRGRTSVCPPRPAT